MRWRDDEPDDSAAGEISGFENPNSRSDGDRCTTRRVVRSQCRTEEAEPGKFVRRCEKTEELLRDCVGRPVELLQSNKEYTEDDVTDQVLKGSFPVGSSEWGALDFPGLRGDIDAIERNIRFPGLRDDIDSIERNFFGSLGRFFEAAEEIKDGFLSAFRDAHISDGDSPTSSASKRQGVPIESDPQQGEALRKLNDSPLARDV
ncbi:Mal d 1-associated protein [Trema orientale]|uniref:Mal d 1-associated protein n=1 Tax=Trema orientale TaxID=63057 RepID=A0A2P5FKQ8_TREOI|nr:Mal d 1-associated protein [Trema orientale]